MSGSSSTALCARNAHITLYDVTTWRWVNLVNPGTVRGTVWHGGQNGYVICTKAFSPAPFPPPSRKMWLQGVVVFVPQLLLVLASQQDGPELHFSASGQFKIAQFADCKR